MQVYVACRINFLPAVAVYDLTHPGKLIELQHSQSWSDFLADLESEIDCPQPERSND